MAKLNNWHMGALDDGNIYLAPELRTRLTGRVYGHPRFEDGDRVTCTRIIEVNGKTVRTKNTTYELGDPDPKWLKWLEENDISFDADNPIKMKDQND